MIRKTDAEIQQTLAILNGVLNEAQDDNTIDEIKAQIWVLTFKVENEDDILDRNLQPDSEAAAFRAVEWLQGMIETEMLIVI